MRLSIIIPVYNTEKYLPQCLDSILASIGAEVDVEILLINDGSTDKSGCICDSYTVRDNRIHAIHKTNGGVSSARNIGVDCAAGEYIAWVDSDDLVEQQWYPQIMQAISEHHPDVILIDTVRFDDRSEEPECYGRPGGIVPQDQFLADVLADVRLQGGMPNKIVRQTFWKNVRFNPSLLILEDFAVIYPLLKDAERVYYIDAPLYRYRQHGDSLLHHNSITQALSGVQTARKRFSEVPEQYKNDAAVALAIQQFMFCRCCILSGEYGEEYRRCLKSIRKQLPFLLCHEQPTIKWKIKFLLLSAGFLKPLLLMKKA